MSENTAKTSDEMPKSDTPLTDSVWAELTETTDILKFARTLEKRLNAERTSKEQAEARLATALNVLQLLMDNQNGCPLPKYKKDWNEAMRQGQALIDNTTPPPIVAERDALKIEYESRAAWIAEMNKILGYDNADGFHSEPSPHEIARQMKAELARLRAELKSARTNAESWEACVRSQQTSKAPCGHWDGLCHTEDGGKTVHCYQCERDAAEKERDSARNFSDTLMQNLDAIRVATEFLDDGSGPNTATALTIKAAGLVKELRAKLELVKSVLSYIPSCDISPDAFMASMSSGAWCQWMDKRNKTLAQLDAEAPKVGGAFYNGIEWFGAWLVDHAEGETVAEEVVRQWAVEAWNKHLAKLDAGKGPK